MILKKGNKQRYRENKFDVKSRSQTKTETTFYTNTKIAPINSLPTDHSQSLLKLTPSFQQSTQSISIVSKENVDLLTPGVSQKNLILSEDSKSVLKAQHIPVKIHVDHQPSNDDTQRIYNPYFIKNEYERYTKNGFIFEPKVPHEKVYNLKQADAIFSTESISPYNRNISNTLSYKSHNLKKKESTGSINEYNNLSYVVDSSTEFQNLNNLKNADYKFKKNYRNFKSGSETGTIVTNTSIENINEMPSQHVDANIFEDKYDVEKKNTNK